MIHSDVSNLINEQVGHEFSASLQYISISSWFDAEALPELSKYFATQAEEERMHAMKMIQYLNDTGQTVDIPAIPKPMSTFDSVEKVLKLAYKQELRVTDQIKGIYNLAASKNDSLTQNFLQWFLQEQVEEVASMDTLLKIAQRAQDNLFRIEDFVARQGHPDDTAAA